MEPINDREQRIAIALTREQRADLTRLCRIHEEGLNQRILSRRSALIALSIFFLLASAVLLLEMSDYAPPAYLFLGFIIGAQVRNLRIVMMTRRIWPLYDTVIDWDKVYTLLKPKGDDIAL